MGQPPYPALGPYGIFGLKGVESWFHTRLTFGDPVHSVGSLFGGSMPVRAIVADALSLPLPASSVHCVVTSPPYWGLRAYGGEASMIGLESTFEQHPEALVAVFRA